MPRQKKKQHTITTPASGDVLNPTAEWIAVASNMQSTITAEDRTAMQNARQRHLKGANHEPSMHIVVPNSNNLPNAAQGGFLTRLEHAVDAALSPQDHKTKNWKVPIDSWKQQPSF